MSRIYNRMKGAFRRKSSSAQTYYNPESYNEERIDSPNHVDENEVNENSDVHSVGSDNPAPQQSQRQGQTRDRASVEEDPPAAPVNLPNSEIRSVPDIPQTNPPPNVNTVPIPTPPTPAALPTNPNPPIPPTRADLSSLLNRKRRPFTINPNSQLVGFPGNRSFRPPWLARSAFTPRPQTRQSNMPNLEIDYPIENVFTDGSIPPSVAIKINEAVEHDRFGNTHYTHRYAYKPQTQHIAIGNNQHLECRLVENTHQMGRRYIREINYPQERNLNNMQLITDNRPQLNCFPAPVYHFTAHALPNDPMRSY